MDSKRSMLLLSLFISTFAFTFAGIAVAGNDQNKLQNYMIFVRPDDHILIRIEPKSSDHDWHSSLLYSVFRDSGPSRLIYSFNTVVNGFAARLTEDEVSTISKESWFQRAVLANNRYNLFTSHTPRFLNLNGPYGLWERNKNMGEGVIIGVIDTGITPGHPSFDDTGMPPPPAKWKGHCDFNATYCNKKIIGAKSFLKAGGDEQHHVAPVDEVAHGTHTASTAAGTFVKNTSAFGMPMGMVSGMAPRAHLAIYRVCTEDGCEEIDLLKGIEEAVKDGCDVISLSLGTNSRPLYNDTVAIGTFAAIAKGIFVSTASGNSGPSASTLANEAPWLLTVAATSISRRFISTVKLGNGRMFNGETFFQPQHWEEKEYPVVYLGKNGSDPAALCIHLDKKQVQGKIVVCDRGGIARIEKGFNVRNAGGYGMILANTKEDGYATAPDTYYLPASDITYYDGQKIKRYIRNEKNPVATFVFRGVVLDNMWSPAVADFSSRGPSIQNPLILKPDIAGPGVTIFAAIPPMPFWGEMIQYAIMSGTSMACPHLSGIAALIKHAHPNWSPAAIKSAMMTTAYVNSLNDEPITNGSFSPATVFDMGAGHVDPKKALDPGLVYDITPQDYIQYLCGLGYTDDQITTIVHPLPPVKCANVKAITQEKLNLPSFGVPLSTGIAVICRAVTNVGTARATYTAQIKLPKGISATVKPATLQFTSVNETQKFEIDFKWDGTETNNTFGEFKWVSAKRVVRSSIAFQLAKPTAA